jgi:hypothetical protein
MAESSIFTPYINRNNEDDPLMQYVPFATMGIAANRPSLPKSIGTTSPKIDHVGDANPMSAGGKR